MSESLEVTPITSHQHYREVRGPGLTTDILTMASSCAQSSWCALGNLRTELRALTAARPPSLVTQAVLGPQLLVRCPGEDRGWSARAWGERSALRAGHQDSDTAFGALNRVSGAHYTLHRTALSMTYCHASSHNQRLIIPCCHLIKKRCLVAFFHTIIV